ncbi:MAG: homoserine dehydrogenase [Bacteroidetes bacterium]|nr:homoserine dehydrogenase [Bacteroidota bacterium]
MKKSTIGLFGFGVVGEGIYQVLAQKPQLGVTIKKIVIKQVDKKRNAPENLFSTDANSILNDPEIDLIVELIDDAEAALDIVLKALNSGRSVVSANKKMIAENLSLLIETAKKNNVSFLYEAAVCGSVPIIRNLEEYFDNDLVSSVRGIVNGSTNFILTQMIKFGLEYDLALRKAQELGFAESNPSLDVEGWDARNKLKIIILHAFGKLIKDEDILVKGVNSITKFDMDYAKEKDFVIKLIATCKVNKSGEIEEASVLPTFIPKYHPLRLTDNEFNGVLIGGELTDEQFLYGKGAGRYPTSSAVLSDISAYLFDYKYAYKKRIKSVDKVTPPIKKFYISYKKENNLSLSSLGESYETYESSSHCYVTVNAKMESVLSLCEQPDVSVICFE